MSEHRLVNEGVSSKAAERNFGKFNKLIENEKSAERMAGVIGALAVDRRPAFWQLRARKYARVVKKVLDTTQNGERIGASDRTWGEIFNNNLHNTAIRALSTDLSPHEFVQQRRKIGLHTLGVVAWLNTAEGKNPSMAAENELVTAA